jgi:DNA-binding XRE family transcriptional regulator
MEVLELVAERSLGKVVLSRHSGLKSGLRRIDRRTGTQPASKTSAEEKERIAAIIELCFEYKRESDAEERENILRTLDEIVKNEPIELPTQTLEQWEDRLTSNDREYAKVRRRDEKRVQDFLKTYFLLKHKAGLKTQAEVGKAAGLERTQVTVLESGEHMPQQKTLQKLAKAFRVEVTELMYR